MATNSKAFKEGRDTVTGQFVTLEKARNGSAERYVVEHIPKKGFGDA